MEEQPAIDRIGIFGGVAVTVLATHVLPQPIYRRFGVILKFIYYIYILPQAHIIFSKIMAAAAINNGTFALNFSFLTAILFMTALVTARPIVNKERPCEEIYIVGEGETLQTISEKCHAPFILIDNPHIQDTDDISEGLPLQIAYQW